MPETEYRETSGSLCREHLLSIGAASLLIFPPKGRKKSQAAEVSDFIGQSVNGHKWIHLCMAYEASHLVGYKLGRSNDPRTFESWMGGVLPAARNRGIATELSRRQEEWCRSQGFRFLTTETSHDNKAMLILNLKQGFHIAGTYLDRSTNMKVVLQKSLN